MMHNFLANNRNELIQRCTDKVAKRPTRSATKKQLENGIPRFLDQLTRTLEAELGDEAAAGLKISGASGGAGSASSEMGMSAAAHGTELLNLDYTIDQVVHDYGDLCQAITDLAVERDAPFSVDEFRTLNRCLDNAIADSVTEFSFQRDSAIATQNSADSNERIGFLMHEFRNSLSGAMLAVSALEAGSLPIAGATGSVLKRSHAAMVKLIDQSFSEVRIKGATHVQHRQFSLASFIDEAAEVAELDARVRGCLFTATKVDPLLEVAGNRDLLLASLANLLNNAFKFTHPHTEVTLSAFAYGDQINISVKDNCGGLPFGNTEQMFTPFTQHGEDRTGLGLGLSIARQSVDADGGTLSVENLPGVGCIFTISLPRSPLH